MSISMATGQPASPALFHAAALRPSPAECSHRLKRRVSSSSSKPKLMGTMKSPWSSAHAMRTVLHASRISRSLAISVTSRFDNLMMKPPWPVRPRMGPSAWGAVGCGRALFLEPHHSIRTASVSGRSHFAFPYLVSFRVRMLGAFPWRGIWVQMCANRVHV